MSQLDEIEKQITRVKGENLQQWNLAHTGTSVRHPARNQHDKCTYLAEKSQPFNSPKQRLYSFGWVRRGEARAAASEWVLALARSLVEVLEEAVRGSAQAVSGS